MSEPDPRTCPWRSHSRPEGYEPCDCAERLGRVEFHTSTPHESGPAFCAPCSEAINEWVQADDPKHLALLNKAASENQ